MGGCSASNPRALLTSSEITVTLAPVSTLKLTYRLLTCRPYIQTLASYKQRMLMYAMSKQAIYSLLQTLYCSLMMKKDG